MHIHEHKDHEISFTLEHGPHHLYSITIPSGEGAKIIELGPMDMYCIDSKGNRYIPPSDTLFNFSFIYRMKMTMVQAAEVAVKLPKLINQAISNCAPTGLLFRCADVTWEVNVNPISELVRFKPLETRATFYSKMTGDKMLSRKWQADAGMFFDGEFIINVDDVKDTICPRLREFVEYSRFLNDNADSSAE